MTLALSLPQLLFVQIPPQLEHAVPEIYGVYISAAEPRFRLPLTT